MPKGHGTGVSCLLIPASEGLLLAPPSSEILLILGRINLHAVDVVRQSLVPKEGDSSLL